MGVVVTQFVLTHHLPAIVTAHTRGIGVYVWTLL